MALMVDPDTEQVAYYKPVPVPIHLQEEDGQEWLGPRCQTWRVRTCSNLNLSHGATNGLMGNLAAQWTLKPSRDSNKLDLLLSGAISPACRREI